MCEKACSASHQSIVVLRVCCNGSFVLLEERTKKEYQQWSKSDTRILLQATIVYHFHNTWLPLISSFFSLQPHCFI